MSQDAIVVRISPIATSEADEPDIEIDSRNNNVMGVSFDGRHKWTAPAPPKAENGDERAYEGLFEVTGKVVATADDGFAAEFDPPSGTVKAKWEDYRLPIGDEVVQIHGDLQQIVKLEDVVLVSINRMWDDGGDTYAFRKDGTRMWRSKDRFGSIKDDGDTVWAIQAAGGRSWERFPINVETGELGDGEMYKGHLN